MSKYRQTAAGREPRMNRKDAIVVYACVLSGVFVAALLIVEHVAQIGVPLP